MSDIDFSGLVSMRVEISHKIAHIQFCRPDKLNSMIPEFWKELPEVIRLIDRDSSARVIVISSQGKHFSAGMDLTVFSNMAKSFSGEPARLAERMRRMVLELQETFNPLEQCRIPVLAAVQGGAIGGALSLLAACDCRYCTKDAFFTLKETEIGMTADVGVLQRLPYLIPEGLVRELAFTGRNMESTEAKACGLVNQVFDDQATMLEGVMKIAAKIAANSPLAVTGCKEMINYSRDHSIADSLNYMATWQSGMIQMTDIKASMEARQTKQVPEYDELYPKVSLMNPSD